MSEQCPSTRAASGQFDRAVNPADGVGSLKQGPRTHPAHVEGRLVYNGADRDGQNRNLRRTASSTVFACLSTTAPSKD